MKKFVKWLLLGLVVFLVACSNDEYDAETNGGAADFPVATMNGANIYYSQVVGEISLAQGMLTFGERSVGERTFEQAVREEAVLLAAFNVMIRQFAAEQGVELSEDDMDNIHSYIGMYIDMHGYDEFMEIVRHDGFYSYEQIVAFFEIQLIFGYLLEAILDNPAEFAPFEAYLQTEEYEMLAAKHILARFLDFDTEEEAWDYAYAKLVRVQAGEDFAALVREYGQDPGMDEFPYGYTFTAGVMDSAFEIATRNLEIGQTSEIIRSAHGYHIILRVEPIEENLMFPWGYQPLSPEERRAEAVFMGIESMVNNAEIVFLPELENVAVQ